MRTAVQSVIIAALVLWLVGAVGAAPSIPTLTPPRPGVQEMIIALSSVVNVTVETGGSPGRPPAPPGLEQTPRVGIGYLGPQRGLLNLLFYLTRSTDQQCYQLALTAKTGYRSMRFYYRDESVIVWGAGPSRDPYVLRTLEGCAVET